MTDILARLAAPFNPASVSWRVGATNAEKTKGLALAYLDSRDIQDRLDEVCGLYWQVRNPWASANKLACDIGIKIGDEWIWRGDGAGDSDVEAAKGAFSDSFKRAAVRWGVGRYLYDVKSPWVALVAHGRSFAIAEGELPKLRALLANSASTAPPRPIAQAGTPSSGQSQTDDDFKIVADQIKRKIDDALDSVTVRDIIEGKDLADLAGHSKSAAAFLRDRADKKLGIIMQGRKAA